MAHALSMERVAKTAPVPIRKTALRTALASITAAAFRIAQAADLALSSMPQRSLAAVQTAKAVLSESEGLPFDSLRP